MSKDRGNAFLRGADPHRYDDMLEMPHHQSSRHPHMGMLERAAQFSPFAALTGYEAELEETARLTEQKRELTEDEKSRLDARLQWIAEKLTEIAAAGRDCRDAGIEVEMTWFAPDLRKAGGEYRTEKVRIRKLDTYSGEVVLADQSRIPMKDLIEIR